jgi:hypothetical protein
MHTCEQMTTIPISLEHKIASRASAPCDLTVRLLDMTKPHAQSKVVFLVRHGESKWNAAQKSRDFLGLMSHDHPLNEMGLQQALELNARWKQPPDADNECVPRIDCGVGFYQGNPIAHANLCVFACVFVRPCGACVQIHHKCAVGRAAQAFSRNNPRLLVATYTGSADRVRGARGTRVAKGRQAFDSPQRNSRNPLINWKLGHLRFSGRC